MNTREHAIKFLEDRAKEEAEKEHNFSYEIENCIYHIKKGKEKTEREVLDKVKAMGIESLNPEMFKNLEEILHWLKKNRHIS